MSSKLYNLPQKLTKRLIIITFLIFLAFTLTFWFGVVIGSKVQPRSVLALNKCTDNCWEINEMAGFVSSIGISLNAEDVFDSKQNDNCFSLQMVNTSQRVHFVMIPKTDIKDLGGH